MSRRKNGTLSIGIAALLSMIVAGPASALEWEAGIYLWMLGMDGDTSIRGNDAEVDLSFGDIASNLDMAASLHLEGAKEGGGLGFFFDVFWADLGQDLERPLGEISMQMSFIEGAVTYATDENFQLFLGARRIGIDMTLKFDFGLPGFLPLPDRVEGDVSWTDLMVGGRVGADIGEKWGFWTRLDLAGFGLSSSSRFTWNLTAMGRRRFGSSWSFILGYRILDIDYADSDKNFKFDMRMAGPVLAVSYAF